MDFQAVRDGLIASLLSLTNSSKFLKPSEVLFLRSDLALSKKFDEIAGQTVVLINDTARVGFALNDNKNIDDDTVVHQSVDEDFKRIIAVLDDFYESADIHLDDVTKSFKKKIRISSNATAAYSNSTTGNLLLSPNQFQPIAKSQLAFRDKVDNNNTPWIPIIKSKPNAMKALDSTGGMSEEVRNHLSTLGHSRTPHPYKFEIENINYPSELKASANPVKYTDLAQTPLHWIDSLASLESLVEKLNSSTEFAVDLEHHDYRSFQGFTCLIQISTRAEDFIIDALKLRHELFRLNESFTNPKIIKVFHGAEMDIIWLQRDFGVYVVNLFDTFHASHCLEMDKHSFAFLLDKYCSIQADKKYQRADWRQRPLSKEMINYARSDTHYLLYIYDLMRNEMVEKSENLVKVTLERSAETSLKTYEKPIYDAESGEGNGGWKNLLRKQPEALNEENFAVFRAVHGWRDHLARTEDESPVYVMPNHILFILARFMPTNAKDLVAVCSPVPPLTRAYATDIAKLVEQTLKSVREKLLASTLASAALATPLPRSNLKAVHVTTKSSFIEPTLLATPSAIVNPVYLDRKQSSMVFGNLFNDRQELAKKRAQDIASKIEGELFLVAPGLLMKEASVVSTPSTTSIVLNQIVKPSIRETSQIVVMKGDQSPDALLAKRKQSDDVDYVSEITSLPISTIAIKKSFDFESAKKAIAMEKPSSSNPSFDPQAEQGSSSGRKKGKKLKSSHKKQVGRSGIF